MKCTNCGKEIENWRAECPYCKMNFEKNKQNSSNAKYLNIMANINLVICIIGAISIIISSIIYANEEYLEITEIIWIPLVIAIGLIIGGFTIFFLLRTIIDIYRKIEK
mgnify:CR=1 FL=1